MTLREGEPRDPLQAKVNLRFSVAAALRDGKLTYRHYSTSAIADPELVALRRLIEVRVSQDLPDNDEFPADIRVELEGGEVMVERREAPAGGTALPLNDAQVAAKFLSCAEVVLDISAIDRIIERVMQLESLEGIDALCLDLQGSRLSPP
jgi:2-methylcitrate dehydratase PrpD